MTHKITERSPSEVIREAKPLPMSKLSDNFFEERVARVSGKLVMFNDELIKNFPIKKEDIEKNLSVFVDWKGKNVSEKDIITNMLGLLEHGRSLSFNLKFADVYGNVYNYVEVKGVGMPQKSIHAGEQPVEKHGQTIWGLMNLENAKADWEASNLFIKNGIKTSAPIAIIEIKEVIMADGEKVGVEELKKRKIIPESFQPVLYVRGFSELMRVDEAEKEDFEKFAAQRGMSIRGYTLWWVERQANNLARIHNLNKSHGHLIPQNLTLDAGMVDNSTVVNSSKFSRLHDITVMLNSVSSFSKSIGENETEMQKLFLTTYMEKREVGKEEFQALLSQLKKGEKPELFSLVTEIYKNKFSENFSL
ncbi:MAG: hypothetical protein QXF56_00040 [Candidatus Micrarchaeia archaeon]